jgi:hypothetical protein
MDFDAYEGLTEAIADALMRDDLTSQIPLFIRLCEASVGRNLRISDMETVATLPMVDGEITLPADFIEVINIEGDDIYEAWTPITLSQSRRDYPTESGGITAHYTITGSTLKSWPSGGDADVLLTYYARPPALTPGNSNWLLQKAPDIYLYGSLKHSAPWLEDDGRIQVWEMLYQQALSEVRRTDEIRSGTMISTVYLPHE